MGRFIARRLLQALPTVAGVVLITFVLFNVVGGSPAALVLGQNAGARAGLLASVLQFKGDRAAQW